MKKWTLYSAIIVFFVLSILLMTASSFLDWFGTETRWQKRTKALGVLISTEQWDQAFEEATALEEDWRRVLRYIQLSVELDEYRMLEQQFIKLKTALHYQDPLQSETERRLIENTLHRLGN